MHDLQLGADDLQLREDLRQDPDAAGRKIVGASEPLEPETSVEDPAAFQTHPRKKQCKFFSHNDQNFHIVDKTIEIVVFTKREHSHTCTRYSV